MQAAYLLVTLLAAAVYVVATVLRCLGSRGEAMDIIGALGLATKSLELAKAIKDIDKKLGEAELKAKAAELLSNLADVKVALVETRDELEQKDREIARLKAAFQLKAEGVRRTNFLYDKAPDGQPKGQPYCPRCEQIDGVMIKLTYDEGMRGNAICPHCKSKYRHVQVFNDV
jgi:hypothetical protein